jgi:UDP-N-acetylglucosamine transferase subunit ALG13
MIYVTVGTHEQQFNRLIKYVDELKSDKVFDDDVIIQSGYSDYKIRSCAYKELFSYKKVTEFFEKARIIITHGGPSSMIQALQYGKIPIVVPRLKRFNEHINDHQLDFCRTVSERYDNIILIEDIEDLKDAILRYDEIAASKKLSSFGNNAGFNEEFRRIVEEL